MSASPNGIARLRPRVALVHDWLTGMRGGERVLERLCALFPAAPIYTLLWNRGSVSPAIESHPIHVSFVQSLPRARRHYRWYLPLFPAAIESLEARGFDAVISTSHCAAKGITVSPGTFHFSYVFTPMRYVWELEAQYFPHGRFPWPLGWMVRKSCQRLREWDVETSRRPDVLVAISSHVAERIARHYRREAEVIPPPVDLARFSVATEREDGGNYYLVAGAFAPYKRTELAIEACRRLGRSLKVVGTGQEESRLRRLAGSGIEFLGWVSDPRMARLYAGARALLFPGEEDFGIVPVESLAGGCPVIALGRGGAVETVARGAAPEALERIARGETAAVPGGVMFGTQTVESLCDAIRFFERLPPDRSALRGLAEPFAAERFDRDFLAAFERRYAEHVAGVPDRPAAGRPERTPQPRPESAER